MAKILVCADGFFGGFSPVALEPYIDGFINSLVRNGNEVMAYIAMDYNNIRNKISKKVHMLRLRQEVLSFNPDLIIAFNNAINPYFAKKPLVRS